jgi:hypothetical protein
MSLTNISENTTCVQQSAFSETKKGPTLCLLGSNFQCRMNCWIHLFFSNIALQVSMTANMPHLASRSHTELAPTTIGNPGVKFIVKSTSFKLSDFFPLNVLCCLHLSGRKLLSLEENLYKCSGIFYLFIIHI